MMVKVKVKVAQSCPTLCDSMDLVHGILQAMQEKKALSSRVNKIPYDYTVEVTNRFKGLELVDRVPKESWMEICNSVQEAVTKTISKKKKCMKAKW